MHEAPEKQIPASPAAEDPRASNRPRAARAKDRNSDSQIRPCVKADTIAHDRLRRPIPQSAYPSTSSMTNEVCAEPSSLAVNVNVTGNPSQGVRSSDSYT